MWEGTVAAPAVWHIWGIAGWSLEHLEPDPAHSSVPSQLCFLCIFWVIALQGNHLCVSRVASYLTQCISLGMVGTLIVQLAASDLQASFGTWLSLFCSWLVPCTTIYFCLCLELESNGICGFYMESVVSQCMHVSLSCTCDFHPLLFCSLLVPTSRCSIYCHSNILHQICVCTCVHMLRLLVIFTECTSILCSSQPGQRDHLFCLCAHLTWPQGRKL